MGQRQGRSVAASTKGSGKVTPVPLVQNITSEVLGLHIRRKRTCWLKSMRGDSGSLLEPSSYAPSAAWREGSPDMPYVGTTPSVSAARSAASSATVPGVTLWPWA